MGGRGDASNVGRIVAPGAFGQEEPDVQVVL